MNKAQDLLSDLELEHILSSTRTSPLEWIGNEAWSKQMSMLEQLNVQAAVEADRGGEERVRDAIVEAEKLPILVHELLLLESWRLNILPRILKLGKPTSSFQVRYNFVFITFIVSISKYIPKGFCILFTYLFQHIFFFRFTWSFSMRQMCAIFWKRLCLEN